MFSHLLPQKPNPTSTFKETAILPSVVFTASNELSDYMFRDLSTHNITGPSYFHKNSEHEAYQAPALDT
jgi:hypothetical protein